jgi:hypothetical protein
MVWQAPGVGSNRSIAINMGICKGKPPELNKNKTPRHDIWAAASRIGQGPTTLHGENM